MPFIQLKSGEHATVDVEDFEKVSRYTWHLDSQGYAKHSYRENDKVKSVYMHQVILPNQLQIDHEDGNRLNNTRKNLRPATHAQNQANTLKHHKKFKLSSFYGVSFDRRKGKWFARIGSERAWLGYFEDETAAAKAYNEARIKRYGAYAKLNVLRPL